MTNRIPWGPDSPGYPECPVPAGHDCTVWFRDADEVRHDFPEKADWQHRGLGSDIIAYCDHDAPGQVLTLPADIVQFLMGTGALEGVHFGDDHPSRKGKFWWRTVIRERVPAIRDYLKGAA